MMYGDILSTCCLSYLQFWWKNMVNKTTGQVADHFDTNGNVEWWKFTYNEGLMIGASTELYHATKSKEYLSNAAKIVSFVLSSETTPTSYGPVLFDGTNSQCKSDCMEFKGPAFRNLALYYSVTHDAKVRLTLSSMNSNELIRCMLCCNHVLMPFGILQGMEQQMLSV